MDSTPPVTDARSARQYYDATGQSCGSLARVVMWCVSFMPGATAIWQQVQENTLLLAGDDGTLATLAADLALLVEFERRYLNNNDGDSR
jgi:hypothetical protein